MKSLALRLARSSDAGRPAVVLFAVAAAAVGVAGYLHGRLWHEGYGDVPVVGPLFWLNVVGSAAVILLLLAGRPALFAGGALSISVGAIVSIQLSHRASFFKFSEEGYSSSATAILVAEAVAALLTVAGVLVARQRLLAPAEASA